MSKVLTLGGIHGASMGKGQVLGLRCGVHETEDLVLTFLILTEGKDSLRRGGELVLPLMTCSLGQALHITGLRVPGMIPSWKPLSVRLHGVKRHDILFRQTDHIHVEKADRDTTAE